MQLVERLEVVRQPVAQVLGLANVDDAPLAVTPLVYARLRGNVGGFRTEQVASIPNRGAPFLFTPLPSDWVPASDTAVSRNASAVLRHTSGLCRSKSVTAYP